MPEACPPRRLSTTVQSSWDHQCQAATDAGAGDGPEHLWGWVPQVFFEHFADGSAEQNLPECDQQQRDRAGIRFAA
jgi:hypothetical protein